MSDLASTAVEFIERLDRGDFEQYVDSLSPRVVEWLRRSAPYLLREGRAASMALRSGLPLGAWPSVYETDTVRLKPGDRLLFLTDGYLERNAAHVDIEGVLAATVGRHPRQTVLELAGRILEATGGDRRDDATVLCFDWYGEAGMRDATGGASRARTTSL